MLITIKKELLQIIGVVKKSKLQGTFNPLRNEIASVLVDEVKIKKTDAKLLKRFIKEVKTLTTRYSVGIINSNIFSRNFSN